MHAKGCCCYYPVGYPGVVPASLWESTSLAKSGCCSNCSCTAVHVESTCTVTAAAAFCSVHSKACGPCWDFRWAIMTCLMLSWPAVPKFLGLSAHACNVTSMFWVRAPPHLWMICLAVSQINYQALFGGDTQTNSSSCGSWTLLGLPILSWIVLTISTCMMTVHGISRLRLDDE